MATYIVYVSNGYGYEYEAEIEASSVFDARNVWKKRGDCKTVNFRVSLKK